MGITSGRLSPSDPGSLGSTALMSRSGSANEDRTRCPSNGVTPPLFLGPAYLSEDCSLHQCIINQGQASVAERRGSARACHPLIGRGTHECDHLSHSFSAKLRKTLGDEDGRSKAAPFSRSGRECLQIRRYRYGFLRFPRNPGCCAGRKTPAESSPSRNLIELVARALAAIQP